MAPITLTQLRHIACKVTAEAGLKLLEWRGHFSLYTSETAFLGAIGKLLPSQKTGLLAAGLTTEEEINELTAEIDAAVSRPPRRSTTFIFVDAIGEVPNAPTN